MDEQVISTTVSSKNLKKVVENYHVKFDMDNDKYEINIPAEFCYDGASIPRSLWFIFGTPYDCKNDTPGCIHDYLYRNQSNNQVKCNDQLITVDRYNSDNIFYHLLCKNGVYWAKALTMFYGVHLVGFLFFKKY